MIIAVAFITGFKYTIREKLYTFIGHVHIELYNPNHSQSLSLDPITASPSLERQVQQLPHIKQVFPFVQRPAIVQAHGQMEGIFLKGVNNQYRLPATIQFTGKKIDYSDTSYSKQILLSQTTADKLNVQAGDTVQVYFLEPGALLPRIRKVQIAGIFHTGMQEVDKFYGLSDIRLLQRINGWKPTEISGYQIDLDNDKYSDTTANLIFYNYLQSPLTTYTTRDIYPNIFDWLDLQDVNGRIILAIMAIVAIINLAAALTILIVEQARTVGLLKALGMAYKNIRQIFLYHATLIAGTGVIAGNLFAFALCWLQIKTGFLTLSEDTYYMKQVPVRIIWWQVAAIDITTLVVCVLCMWLPTLYIRRISPARVLQFK